MRLLGRSRDGKGQALVEFAFSAMLLITLVLGVIDFGWLIKDYLSIYNAAREGARVAAIGKTTAEITTAVLTSGAAASLASGDVHLDRMAAGTSTWGGLGNTTDGTQNNAAPGDRIRVSVTPTHRWITGFFGSTSGMYAEMIMRRE